MSFLTRVNYMKHARLWLGISLALVLASVVALFTLGLNTGIEFTGGSYMDVRFEGSVTSAQVEQLVRDTIGRDVQVLKSELKGEANAQATQYFIRTPELKAEDRDKLLTNMKQLGTYEVMSEDAISGSVSKELTRNAILALAIAAILQAGYLWIRFELKFGVAAVVGLVHDVLLTLGILSLLQVQVTASFVAAILTVLGYSMNDTVVVFDRIRENLKKRKKGQDLVQLTTRSIQEVVVRSLKTGISVQMMLIAMLIWGGESLWDMALTLFIGVTIGTYSSIFVASALWLVWSQRDERGKRRPARKARPVKA